jgi:hypothetical protein
MSEKVALVILSGVVKLAWFITELVVNSKAGKKFSSLLPREVLLTSLDAFGKMRSFQLFEGTFMHSFLEIKFCSRLCSCSWRS